MLTSRERAISRERTACPDDAVVGNVARVYARLASDLRNNTHTAPTFEDAVELHRVIAAIEASSDGGHRVSPAASNRPLPLIA
jgi:predicted dehydrogenase